MSKKHLLGILAVAMTVILMSPGKALTVSAEGNVSVKSENNKVPVYKAGQSQKWAFTVTNNTDGEVRDIVVRPELGDTADVWPFQTDWQDYECSIKELAEGEQGNITFDFTQREDVPTTRYTLQFGIYYKDKDGKEQVQLQKFYVNTTAKEQDVPKDDAGNQQGGSLGGDVADAYSGGFSNGDAAYSGEGGSGSVPRVIVTGFSTNPSEVRAGSDFTLTIHLKNTSKSSKVQNMLFDLSAPTEGADEQTMAPAFLPTSGSSSVYLEGIKANGTADISIQLNAKADLLQKPYSIDLAVKYEDADNAQVESTSSLSIPVKQDARFELSEFEISPASVAVGDEANVMCNLYNLGRIKLYNVKAVFEGSCIEKEEVFVGNVESGASASIDAMLEGKKKTEGPAKVTMTLSYEDESGKLSEKKEELQLEVTEPAEEEAMMEEPMEETGKFPVLPIVILVVIAAAIAGAAIIWKKKKKKKIENEEEALLYELDGPSEDERE